MFEGERRGGGRDERQGNEMTVTHMLTAGAGQTMRFLQFFYTRGWSLTYCDVCSNEEFSTA